MVLLILFFSLNAVAEAVILESINGLKAPSELELLKNNQKAVREQLIDKKINLKESRKKISSDLLQLIDENYLPPGQTRENLQRQMQELKQYRLETSHQRGMASEKRELVYVYTHLAPAVDTRNVDKYAREVTHRDEANHLAEKNIIYVSSAGNYGKRHYQGMYYDQGDGCHDFSGGSSDDKYLYVRIQPGETAIIVLQWDDKFGSSSNDYDLYLWDFASGIPLGTGNDLQSGSSDPLEAIVYTNNDASPVDCLIDIYKFSGSPKNLEVFIYDCTVYTNNISPADSIFGHPAVPGAIAVGAINAAAPSQIANYSSQGPVTIRYPAAETRNKPDVCGIDGVRVTGAGGFSSTFYGTSAAAPHVAAIAALTWAQYPEKTAAEIRALLLSEVVDLGLPGFDYIYGTGRADALNCIQKGDSTPPAYQGAAISEDYKTVTLTFSENLIANTADLKGAVTFAADGTTFASLGRGDTVSLSDNKLVVTFKAALTGNKNRLMVAAGSLKDAAGNVLNSTVTTDALEAGINGDLNGDNVVDLTDLLWLAQHLGLKEGDPAWESACITDVNNDRVINILDLIMVAELQ